MWLPVAQRELKVASRKSLTYWVRLAAPVLGLALLFFAVPELELEASAARGKIIFKYAAVALFIYSTFAGLYFTAETISRERRDGTLPLLQLTGMRPVDLLLGKLVASSLPGVFGFFAAAPLLAVPFLLGGVTPVEFIRVLIVLLGTLFLSLAVGLFASSQSASTGEALKQTLGTVLSIFGLGFVGVLFFGLRNRVLDPRYRHVLHPAENRWIFVFAVVLVWYFAVPTGSPGFLLLQSLFGARGILPFHISFTVGAVILFGMAFFFLVTAKPFLVVDEDASVEHAPAVTRPSPLHRRSHLPKGTDAFRWLLGPNDAELILAFGWALIGGALHLFSNGLIYSSADASTAAIFGWGAFAVTFFIYFLFARRAAEFIVESRRTGLLEVLLVTPLTWNELLSRHRLAFVRFVWFPTFILLSGEILGMWAALRFTGGLERREFSFVFLIITVLTYVCSLFATLWCTLFFALRTKTSTPAAFVTVLLVLAVPALAAFLVPSDSPSHIPGPLFVLLVSAWLYIFVDGAIWAFFRHRLNRLSRGSPALIIDSRAFRE